MIVGFFGSRLPSSALAAAAVAAAGAAAARPSRSFIVPDPASPSSVCAAVLAVLPPSRVSVVAAPAGLPPVAALVARAAAAVRALAAAPRAVALAFPSSACPAGLRPSPVASRCWCGSGSGTWAEVAFCVALGVPVFVAGFPPPSFWPVSVCAGVFAGVSGWWLSPLPAVQPSLF